MKPKKDESESTQAESQVEEDLHINDIIKESIATREIKPDSVLRT